MDDILLRKSNVRQLFKCYKFFTLVLLWCSITLFSLPGRAQISIVTPYPTAAGNLTRGGIDTSTLTVQLTFASACSGVTCTVALPAGVNYVPLSVAKTAGSISGSAIAISGGSVAAPVFSITGISGPGDLTFTIRRFALCGGAGSGKDAITVSSNGCGTASETDPNLNSYTIYAPALSLVAPAANTTASVGSVVSRTATVTNGGIMACIDTLQFYNVLPSGRLKMVDSPANSITAILSTGSLPAASFPAIRRNGDTLFYAIYGTTAFGADGKFCDGEIINIVETDSVKACGSYTTYYGASWGKSVPYCQTATDNSTLTTSNTAASFTNKTAIAPALSGCLAAQYTISDTLINSGVSTYYDRFTITNGTGSSNAYLDTASILISINGGAYAHPGGVVTSAVNANTFACVSGKPQNISYTLPATVLFPAGARIVVVYNVMTGCRDTSTCTAANTAGSYTVTHYYHLTCDATSLNKASNAQATGYTVSMSAFTFEEPAQVPSGATFNVKVPVSFSMTTNAAINARRYGLVTLTVPTGVSLVSAADIQDTGSNVYTQVSGNVISYRFIPNAATGRQSVNFVLRNDLACGYQSVTARAVVMLDSSCAADTRTMASQCYTITTKFKCPGIAGIGCPGVGNLMYSMSRSSYGAPDNDQDGRPDAAGSLNFNKVDPDRYMVGDTLRSVSGGVITGRLAYLPDTFANVFAEWNFPVGTWTPAGTATIIVKRGTTIYTCSNVALTTLTAGKIFRADWRGNSCISGFTSYRTGDSVAVMANFRFSDNATVSSVNTLDASASSTYTYQKDAVSRVVHLLYATNNASPATGGSIGATGSTTVMNNAGYTCDTALYNAYLSGWRHQLTSTAVTATGCATATKSFSATTSTFGGQYFTAEYRPIAIPDTFIVVFPAGWTYTGAGTSPNSTMTYTTKRGVTATVSYHIIPTVTTTAGGLTQLLFDYTTLIQSGTLPFVSTETAVFKTSYSVAPTTCATLTNSKDSVVEYGHLANPFGVSLSRYAIYHTPANTLVYGNRPSVTVTNNTGTLTSNTPAASWDVQVNAVGYAASNVWLALEKGSGTVTVDSVAYLNGTTPAGTVAPIAYGAGNQWYKIASSINASNNQKLRVYFHYSNCTVDSLKAYAGFDCNSYPSSPLSPTCASTLSAPVYFKVLSKASEVQLSVVRQPGGSTGVDSLCRVDSTTFVVSSAQAANIVNPRAQVIVPAGFTVLTPIPVEYPVGSGNWQNITPVSIPGGFEVNLTAHTAIGSAGIKGTAASATATARQAKLKIAYTTDCSYRSGSSINFYGFANRICGDTANGNGINVKTAALNIAGIPTGGGSITMALTLPATTLSCGSTGTLSLVSTPLGGPTQGSDTVVYTLPSGIEYGGNFVPDSNCTGCAVTTTPGTLTGTTFVKVKLPAAITANTPIKYSFSLLGAGGLCGAATIDATAVRTYNGTLKCGATTCAASSKVAGNTVSGAVNRIKPDIALTSLALSSTGSFTPGQNAVFRLDYQNNGSQNAAAGAYRVEYFRSGSPATPFATRALQKAVAVNAGAADTVTLTIPASATNGERISARIGTVLSDSSEQCLCSASSVAMLITPLPVTLLSFSGRLQDAAVMLSWSVAEEADIAGYTVERSTDAAAFAPLHWVAALNRRAGNANYTDADHSLPAAPDLYYRLRIAEQNGGTAYSKTLVFHPQQPAAQVTVVPNPASDRLTVRWRSAGGQPAQLKVFNSIGSCLINREALVQSGTNESVLDVSGLPAGSYLLRIDDGGSALPPARFDVVK